MTSTEHTSHANADMSGDGNADTAVDRFLAAIGSAAFEHAVDVYSSDARLDATVPGWRFAVQGDEAVRDEYGRWFASPNDFVELRREPTPAGEVVEYFVTWLEDGVVHGAHHAHLLTLDPAADRIIDDHVFCGGRWPAPLLADMHAPSFAGQGDTCS
jgi:hypothetical protein